MEEQKNTTMIFLGWALKSLYFHSSFQKGIDWSVLNVYRESHWSSNPSSADLKLVTLFSLFFIQQWASYLPCHHVFSWKERASMCGEEKKGGGGIHITRWNFKQTWKERWAICDVWIRSPEGGPSLKWNQLLTQNSSIQTFKNIHTEL